MTSLPADDAPPSPWRSIWLRPGDTIARVLAHRPTHHVLLLAAVGTIASYTVQLVAVGFTTEILDWHILVAVIIAGAVMGVVTLYLDAFVLMLGGWICGGRATSRDMRAVFAWSFTPTLAGLVICIGILAAIGLGSTSATPPTPATVAQVAVVATGLWSLVMMLVMFARAQRFRPLRAIVAGVFSWMVIGAMWIVLAVAIRTFLFQPFNVLSGSMIPTLLVGDYFFVSKYSYGYSRFSLPFSPALWSGRLLAAEPQRGDVVVFRLPRDDSVNYVQRIVGLPGDRIQMIGGALHINGSAVKRERMDDFADASGGRVIRGRRWRETLPNGVSYETLDLIDNGILDDTPVYTVPQGRYFMLGDNRDNSTDSRIANQVGFVPFDNLVGRALILFLSVDRESGRTGSLRSDRLGLIVR